MKAIKLTPKVKSVHHVEYIYILLRVLEGRRVKLNMFRSRFPSRHHAAGYSRFDIIKVETYGRLGILLTFLARRSSIYNLEHGDASIHLARAPDTPHILDEFNARTESIEIVDNS